MKMAPNYIKLDLMFEVFTQRSVQFKSFWWNYK